MKNNTHEYDQIMSNIAQKEASKKPKVEETPMTEPVRDIDRVLNKKLTTRDERKARSQQLKDWLQEQRMAKRATDGIHTDEDALAKFQYLLRHDLQVRGKPSKAAEIIMADYGFKVPKELITDLAEGERAKLLRHGVAPSRLLKEHGAQKSVSLSQPVPDSNTLGGDLQSELVTSTSPAPIPPSKPSSS